MFRRWFFASMVGSVALCFAGDLMLVDNGEDGDATPRPKTSTRAQTRPTTIDTTALRAQELGRLFP
jgi:hypothetical protein